ncbi:FAD-dependent oxidoreductase [Thauera sp.]|jgi:3-phenylpropionate/trans-cinnamate dioxygenase ferredoxin reductase subunit|uniref:NAD(P)/FAD-dependent oxidoreductase n=1 Tax=Thauera sp. TaxID=1905334 RepID=UPI002CCE64FF|nr:FAD-dependent oxidoreductase [Thauera sp.]HRO36791.1 FAD-dependent oxidoreductase [Thauera sp.]
MNRGVVIIGAGHGGVSLATALRAAKYEGPVTLISDEAALPYHRPPLSKAFMAGEAKGFTDDKLKLSADNFYTDNDIALRLGSPVATIDTAAQAVTLASGERIDYAFLVLATGARARSLPIAGIDRPGVETLRTLADARRIRAQLAQARSLVVIGAGFIGLELAATARQLGKAVTVLEAAPRILGRSVSPRVSEWITARLRSEGVRIELDARITEIAGANGKVSAVREEGREWPADLVIVGAGATPNTALAEAAGIVCDNGIVVDAQLHTSARCVFAIGDCAAHPNPFAGGARIRLESIQNANDQARIVMRNLTGNPTPYHSVPWFWSDLGNIKLQMVGLSIGATDYVVRGEPASGKFSVFHYRGDTLVAVDSINHPADHIQARRLVGGGISPAKAEVADLAVDLKQHICQAA